LWTPLPSVDFVGKIWEAHVSQLLEGILVAFLLFNQVGQLLA
jgi:hypothetical protein